MKESHGEGLANHAGPESCGVVREKGVEALTGVRTGWVFNREKRLTPGCRRLGKARKATSMASLSEMLWNPARSQPPRMYGNTLRENRESHGLTAVDGTAVRIGKSKDARR